MCAILSLPVQGRDPYGDASGTGTGGHKCQSTWDKEKDCGYGKNETPPPPKPGHYGVPRTDDEDCRTDHTRSMWCCSYIIAGIVPSSQDCKDACKALNDENDKCERAACFWDWVEKQVDAADAGGGGRVRIFITSCTGYPQKSGLADCIPPTDLCDLAKKATKCCDDPKAKLEEGEESTSKLEESRLMNH